MALRAAEEQQLAAEAKAAAQVAEVERLQALLAAARTDAKKPKRAAPPFGRGPGMPCTTEGCDCNGNETAHATHAYMAHSWVVTIRTLRVVHACVPWCA